MTTGGPITRAVAAALKDAPLLPRDSGAVALARRYAAALDAAPGDATVLNDLGPKLLAALVALGMAPAGRGVKGGGGDNGPVVSKLNQLRDEVAAKREARQRNA